GSILWHGYISDVTDRKQLEARFLQAQKMEAIGRLAGGVAHDFNNLLTVINGFSNILLSNLEAEDPSYSFVESILDAGKSGANLTAQLLAFGRKTVVAPTLFDLNNAVTRSEKLLRRLIGEHITLTIVTAPSECAVKADPNQLDQVILNLAVNARDAMPSGGELTVRVRHVTIEPEEESSDAPPPGAYAQLSVSDTGCGMSAEVQERIFEPFFTTKEPGKGTGLGLSTLYGIVQQAGGYVNFESQENLGTVFRIYLPLVSLPVSRSGARTPISNDGTETVLLVEDEPAVRAISSAILKSQGYSVIEASGGQEALEIFREQQNIIDILLTDVVMPGMNGQELADAVCEIRPGFPVICVSGYTNDYLVGQMGEAPRYAFLPKPFPPEALSQKIRELLDPQRQNVSALSN
ncbi:MAG: response regulator, partial [Planctomycetaceae bacterium]|nr:response regulator [Planctomycetaceae bacterium]